MEIVNATYAPGSTDELDQRKYLDKVVRRYCVHVLAFRRFEHTDQFLNLKSVKAGICDKYPNVSVVPKIGQSTRQLFVVFEAEGQDRLSIRSNHWIVSTSNLGSKVPLACSCPSGPRYRGNVRSEACSHIKQVQEFFNNTGPADGDFHQRLSYILSRRKAAVKQCEDDETCRATSIDDTTEPQYKIQYPPETPKKSWSELFDEKENVHILKPDTEGKCCPSGHTYVEFVTGKRGTLFHEYNAIPMALQTATCSGTCKCKLRPTGEKEGILIVTDKEFFSVHTMLNFHFQLSKQTENSFVDHWNEMVKLGTRSYNAMLTVAVFAKATAMYYRLVRTFCIHASSFHISH